MSAPGNNPIVYVEISYIESKKNSKIVGDIRNLGFRLHKVGRPKYDTKSHTFLRTDVWKIVREDAPCAIHILKREYEISTKYVCK